MRIDKYVWAIRLFKTRYLASKAYIGEKVKLNGDNNNLFINKIMGLKDSHQNNQYPQLLKKKN